MTDDKLAASHPPPPKGAKAIPVVKPFAHDDKALIVISADPDAISSAVALKRLLWRRVAHVDICSTNEVRRPDNLRLLNALRLPLPHITSLDLKRYTKLAMVDSQPHHSPLTANLRFSVIVDHHPPGPPFKPGLAPDFVDIRQDIGATASILTQYLRSARVRPNQVLATALFYGIKTDTLNFVRQGQIEDMAAFRWLYPMIHHPLLSEIERAPIDRQSFRVMMRALNQTVFSKNFASVFFERLDHSDTLVLAADLLMEINGVNRAVASGVHCGQLVVILRSGGLRSNLGRLASEAFGPYGSAGGHKNMARAEIPLSGLDPKGLMKPAALRHFVHKRLGDILSRKPPDGVEAVKRHEVQECPLKPSSHHEAHHESPRRSRSVPPEISPVPQSPAKAPKRPAERAKPQKAALARPKSR
ncbi:MAG: DHH family phosphoesterase [Deltaproteobacteria bacterium]|jgi:nanoRNase/pAp phosphatase (c-di-AMP/oligoRNAs hydrolase)|nr:DHH family phosphoesterase [Deltaproteobacteria bacterium]